MARDVLGGWSVRHHLAPGHHQFHYFVVESGAYINCGTEGLTADRLGESDDSVIIAPMDMAMRASGPTVMRATRRTPLPSSDEPCPRAAGTRPPTAAHRPRSPL